MLLTGRYLDRTPRPGVLVVVGEIVLWILKSFCILDDTYLFLHFDYIYTNLEHFVPSTFLGSTFINEKPTTDIYLRLNPHKIYPVKRLFFRAKH